MKDITPYFINLDKSVGENFSEYDFSPEGVPLVRYNRSRDWQSNPVTVCQYALNNLQKFLENGNTENRKIFMDQVNWLIHHIEDGPGNSAVWLYRIDIPFYMLTSPWISGMAQGEALSVFIRAFQLTEEDFYLHIADRIWKIFGFTTEQGGVIGRFPGGSIIIEEYPTQPCSCVLNGFILALFGIYDYIRFCSNHNAKRLFDDCIESLESNLNRYDSGFWSYYDLYRPYRLTSRSYHRLHLLLLNKLFEITQLPIFNEVSLRWKSYATNIVCQSKWFLHKIKYSTGDNG